MRLAFCILYTLSTFLLLFPNLGVCFLLHLTCVRHFDCDVQVYDDHERRWNGIGRLSDSFLLFSSSCIFYSNTFYSMILILILINRRTKHHTISIQSEMISPPQ